MNAAQFLISSFSWTVHGVAPDLTRDGCSIPVTLALQDALQKNIVLLPIGACDDGAHSQNEKINRVNYIQGVSDFFVRLKLDEGILRECLRWLLIAHCVLELEAQLPLSGKLTKGGKDNLTREWNNDTRS